MAIKIINDAEMGELHVNDFDGALGVIKHSNPMINDAIDTGIFFARELERIKARSYDVKYANLKFRELFPVSNEADEGTETITYESYDQSAMAKWIGAYGKDLPRADIGGKEVTIPVRAMGISYGFTTKEIRNAAMTGKPLNARKSDAAYRGIEQLLNETAFFGDSDKGLNGLFSHPNIPVSVAPNPGSGTAWSTKTPDQILADLNSLVNDINTNTDLVEYADTVLLPPDQYAYIATTARSANSDTTILEYFVKNNPWIASVDNVVACNECKASVQNAKGLGNFDVAVAYRNQPDAMEVEIPMEMRAYGEQRVGLEILVPVEATTGGMNIYYPLSVNIMTNI